MNARAAAIIRIPVTLFVVGAGLVILVPWVMSVYAPYLVRPGISCARIGPPVNANGPYPLGMCKGLADLYHLPFLQLFAESMFRSLALLVGAALLALVVGTLLGVAAALLRRRVWASGGIVALTTLASAVPAFFVAYFLQIIVILVGATPEGGRRLPVFGFGYDEHLILPLLSISLTSIAFTAQLTATRMMDVLGADFVTAAAAKGLGTWAILRVHVMPHVRPVILEAVGSGLRVAVASLPIIEYLFLWRGIGQLALEAVGVHDAAMLILSGAALASLFVMLSALAEVSRARTLFTAM